MMRDEEKFVIPEPELGFPEGSSPREALLSILEATRRLFGASSLTFFVLVDELEPFGSEDALVEGRLQLGSDVTLDIDEARCEAMARRCAAGLPRLVDEEQLLLLPTAIGALALEAPTVASETAPAQLPLAQSLASHAASTLSWARQLVDAEGRAAEEAAAQQKLRLECARLRELSEIDDLTGLRNRRFFTRILDHEVSRFRRYGHPLSLALIDLDHFKGINDTYGHAVGDEALRYVAARANETMRESDVVARIGGDEIAVIMPDTPLSGGARAVERLREALVTTPFEPEGSRVGLTLSIGVAGVEETGLGESKAFFKAADDALYVAKERGRDQIAVMRDSRIPQATL